MTYIFLDESGQFTTYNHEQYFVVASFTVGDIDRTAKGFKSWCKSRFPKKTRAQSEIKWSQSGISDELRLRTLRYISKLDVRIRFTYFLKKNIPNEYRHGEKLKSGLLYTNIIAETLETYLPITDRSLYVYCDQRKLTGITDGEFKEILKARVIANMSQGSLVHIEMVDSTTNTNIQIVDWIAGALARYLERGPLGEDCYKILKQNIIEQGKEIFQKKKFYDEV